MTALAVAALGLATGAAARPAALAIRDPLIRPTAPGQPVTAAYMTLFNPTARPLRLTGVTCACAASVAPHESREAGGLMQMRPMGAVVIQPRGRVIFAPGGLHLMVMGLRRPVKAGEVVPMRLSFEGLSPITVKFLARR